MINACERAKQLQQQQQQQQKRTSLCFLPCFLWPLPSSHGCVCACMSHAIALALFGRAPLLPLFGRCRTRNKIGGFLLPPSPHITFPSLPLLFDLSLSLHRSHLPPHDSLYIDRHWFLPLWPFPRKLHPSVALFCLNKTKHTHRVSERDTRHTHKTPPPIRPPPRLSFHHSDTPDTSTTAPPPPQSPHTPFLPPADDDDDDGGRPPIHLGESNDPPPPPPPNRSRNDEEEGAEEAERVMRGGWEAGARGGLPSSL
jgi:hypothetical protein